MKIDPMKLMMEKQFSGDESVPPPTIFIIRPLALGSLRQPCILNYIFFRMSRELASDTKKIKAKEMLFLKEQG